MPWAQTCKVICGLCARPGAVWRLCYLLVTGEWRQSGLLSRGGHSKGGLGNPVAKIHCVFSALTLGFGPLLKDAKQGVTTW